MPPQRPSTLPEPAAQSSQYPRWIYHHDAEPRVCHSAEDERAAKQLGWGRTPHPPKDAPAEVDPLEEMRARISGLEKALAALSHDLSEAVAEFRKGVKHGK